MDKFKCLLLIGLCNFVTIYCNPITECPDTENSYYISDSHNRCIYYWCVKGKWVESSPFNCAPGVGTRTGFKGYDNPCTEHMQSCAATGQNGVGYLSKTHNIIPYETDVNPNTNQQHMNQFPSGSGSRNTPNTRYQSSNNGFQNGQQGGQHTNTYGQTQNGNQFQSVINSLSGGTYNQNGQTAVGSGGVQGSSQNNQQMGHKSSGGIKGYFHITLLGHGGKAIPTVPTVPPSPTKPSGQNGHSYSNHVSGGGKPQVSPKIVYKLDGYHIPMGHIMKNIYDAHDCLHNCIKNTSCSGFDFDYKDQTCYFHSQYTVCLDPVKKDYCAHYKLVHCAVTTTTSTLAPTITQGPVVPVPPTFASFQDMCVGSGLAQPFLNTPEDCQNTCTLDPACRGADFDRYNYTCYFHAESTVCGVLMPRSGCTHFRYINCATGTLMLFPATHALGGVVQPKIKDPTECIRICQEQQNCVAIDFDSHTTSCWFHDQLTCSMVTEKTDCVHIRLETCP